MLTDTEIIEKIATEVMGWTIGHNVVNSRRTIMYYQVPNGSLIFDWNPLVDMRDAWMICNHLRDLPSDTGDEDDLNSVWSTFVDLFNWCILVAHDPDGVARMICENALKAKGIDIAD